MRSTVWVLVLLLLTACTTTSSFVRAKTPLPPDSFLQDKILEVGREMGLSLAYENRDEGLFFWWFKVKDQRAEQAGKECEGLFSWYVKRVRNSIAVDDPMAFLPECRLEPKQVSAEAQRLQKDFMQRWLNLVGPVTIIGPTVATHSSELSGEVFGRLLKERIEPGSTMSPGK